MILDEKNLRKDEINDRINLYQIKDGLLFGTDALLLADFICGETMSAYKTGIEFGAGSGVIPLLLAARKKISLIYSLEIQKVYAELAEYNVNTNGFGGNIKIICADLKDCDNLHYDGSRILPHTADVIFTNPPYIKYTPEKGTSGMLSGLDYKNIARREIACDIFDILKSAARLLKNGGDFYIVYRPDRLQSLMTAMVSNNITPKKMKLIFAGHNKPASLVLIKGRQGAGEGLIAENMFI
jgi:tRNA1Val (adenine37-N6)-methyltransferase